MRHLFALLITAFCISLLPSCQKEIMVETETITDTIVDTVRDTITIDLNRGLVAYYPFSGNANDSSGNNKHGNALNGLAYSTDAHNNGNRAANFDGLDDYIEITDATNYFAPPKLSISYQFYLRDVNTRSAMLCKSAFATPTAVSWSTGLALPNDPHFTFTVANGDNPCTGVWGSPNGLGYELKYNAVPLQNNKWYHVTVIFNLGIQMTYLDGNLVSARVGSYSYLNQCANADVRIGGWWQNDIISVNGKIDEVRFYNRILAENEIEFLADEIN